MTFVEGCLPVRQPSFLAGYGITDRCVLHPRGAKQAIVLEEYENEDRLLRAVITRPEDGEELMVLAYSDKGTALEYFRIFNGDPHGCVNHIENFCRKYLSSESYRKEMLEEFYRPVIDER